MRVERWFSNRYAEAREKFLGAAARAGASVTSHWHPLRGPAGEGLAMDIARVGPRDAGKILVTTSATHGVEGYGGSGCQVGLLAVGVGRDLPADTAMLQIHAVNPHGFALERRVTEGNVDLNRNFVDFSHPVPRNAGYDELHAGLCPVTWRGPARVAADLQLLGQVTRRGRRGFQAALTRGQYDHPDGLFFGGREPTWSHRIIRAVAARELTRCRHAAIVDIHTGLGPRGVGEIIVAETTDAAELGRAHRWLGADQVKSPRTGDSVSAVVMGTIDAAYRHVLGADRCTFVTLEFGTVSSLRVLHALRADNWLHVHGVVESDLGRRIKRRLREAFYGDEPAWQQQVWTRTQQVVRQLLAGLSTAA